MVIGGIAIIARGVRRMTTDIDAVVRGDRVLLLMHKDIDLDRVRRRLAELAAMADEPALLVGLERVIKRLASTTAAPELRPPRSANRANSRRHATRKVPTTAKPRKRSRP